MKIHHFLIAFCLLIISISSSFAQTQKSLRMEAMDKDAVFDKLKRFALENDYFIKTLNREEGYIRWNFFSRGKGVFSRDYNLDINVFLSAEDDNATRIELQIQADQIFETIESIRVKSVGVLNDEKYYNNLLSQIHQYLSRK